MCWKRKICSKADEIIMVAFEFKEAIQRANRKLLLAQCGRLIKK